MIIAGELDISVRSLTIGVIGGHYGLPVWAGIAAALTFGVLEGLIKAGRSAPFSQC